MKIKTVNVLEYLGPANLIIHSFNDDDNGNKAAERLFRNCIRENAYERSDEDINSDVENGFYLLNNYEVYLTHSV